MTSHLSSHVPHLDDNDLSTAAAGLPLDPLVREHLTSCLACRAQVTAFSALVEERREALESEAAARPDQSGAILARIERKTTVVAISQQRRLTQSLLALAATAIMAVGIGYLNRSNTPTEVAVVPTPTAAATTVAVEDVLAEMEALLADDSIPGLWVADPITDVDELGFLFANPTS